MPIESHTRKLSFRSKTDMRSVCVSAYKLLRKPSRENYRVSNGSTPMGFIPPTEGRLVVHKSKQGNYQYRPRNLPMVVVLDDWNYLKSNSTTTMSVVLSGIPFALSITLLS
jgi:hypothetical protein